jgi:hypothetical protein
MITANDIQSQFGGGPYILTVNCDVPITEPALTSDQQLKLESAWKSGGFGNILQPAESYQVRAWLIRNGIDLTSIPALITSLTQPGPEREEALMRWEYAVKIPANHPLVSTIASNLGLNIETIWSSILEL